MSLVFRWMLLLAALAGASCTVEEGTRLREGQVLVRSPAVGEGDEYVASLDRGEVLHVRVEQRGLDVMIGLPDGLPLEDLTLGAHVAEEIWWMADEPREFRFEIQAGSGDGDYRLVVEKMGPAEEADRRQAEAFRLVRAGQSARKLSLLEAALKLWQRTGHQVREALTWHEIGQVRLGQGEAEEAVAAYDQAVEVLTPLPESLLRGWMLYQRGRARKGEWQLDEAAKDYQEAGELFVRLGDVGGQAAVENDQAVVSDIQGDLEAACAGYERAGQLYQQAGNAARLEFVWPNLGRCLMKLGAMEKALPILEESLRIAGSDRRRAVALREIGWWYALERRPREALQFLQQSRELNSEDAGLLDRLGTVYRDLGDSPSARKAYEAALEKTNDVVEKGNVEVNLCKIEEMSGHVEEGLKRCQEVLPVFEEIRAAGTLAVIHQILARLRRQQVRLGDAETHAKEAVRQLEWQRALLGSESRLEFSSERQGAYQLLVDLRMDLHAEEPDSGWDARALEASELTRARSLFDLLGTEKVDPGGRVNPVLLTTERRLQKRWHELVGRMEKERTAAEGVGRELSELEEQLATVRRRLRETAPSFALLTLPVLPDVGEFQALLDEETLLLLFYSGNSRSYLWKVRPEEVEGVVLPSGREEVEHLAESWYGSLADSTLGWMEGGLERRRAERLSRILLAPAAEEIALHRRILVVADDVLQRLPFGALPSPVDGENGVPLISAHEVVMMPSASILPILRRQSAERESGEGLLAVVADAVYAADDERLTSPTREAGETHLRRLRGSAVEAQDLVKLADAGPVRLLEGFAARRDEVLGGALNGFRIVHFATHARTKSASGRPLGLVLSLFDEEGRPVDDVLGLDDLYNMALPADLAVLSACGTVLGENVAGEGLVGLTRGFMHAGTPRVVVSLWDVRDTAARESMRRFYGALLDEGAPPGEALRRAQASMWRDGWAVRDWAAFVLQGDWRPFPVKNR